MDHEFVHATLNELQQRTASPQARFRQEWLAERKVAQLKLKLARDERRLVEQHQLSRSA